MARFIKFFPVVLLFSLLKPLYCISYVNSSKHSAQYLTNSADPVLSYLRNGSTYRENKASYQNQEQQVDTTRSASEVYNDTDSQQYNNGDTTTTDSIEDKNIRSIFSFVPFLRVFKNSAPIVKQPDLNSHIGQMISDQPDPYSSLSTNAQKTLNEKLGPVHKEDCVPQNETDTSLQVSTVDTKDCVKNDEKSGKPFCTQLRNYPKQSHLDEIIKTKFTNLESFFGEDLLPLQNISQRIDNKPIEEFLCRSRTRVIYPEAGLNKDYNWMFIINTKKYKQGIRIEECINEGSTCGENTGLTLPNHYKATCRQHYTYRSLVAYANKTVIKDQFKMPSCCKCVLTVS